jgi:adenylosuccinate synthase
MAVEAMSGARISTIGVGPGRDESVVVHDLLAD